jgi:hypothetical protein
MTATNSTPASRADTLQALVGQLGPKDRPFAEGLLETVRRTGRMSDKQIYWINQLIERATIPQQPRRVEAVGNFARVYAMFATARRHLKYPKVHLQLADGRPVALAMSGATSHHPNTINVTDGGPYGQNKWYGRVEVDGTWTAGREFPELAEVANLLHRLSEEPEKTAAEYGQLTGYCCFCSTRLTNEKSTAVGYGPVCADHFGLSAEYKAAKPLFSTLIAAEA